MSIGQLAWVVVLGAVTSVPVRAAVPDSPLRAVDDNARRLIRQTLAVSPTVRRLVRELASTDVIAYVEVGLSPTELKAGTQLVASTRDCRYVRISITTMLGPWERAGMLAHELWHALEIARAPQVRSQDALRALYKSTTAWSDGPDRFETAGAQNAERLALGEVRANSANLSVTNGVTSGLSAQSRRGEPSVVR